MYYYLNYMQKMMCICIKNVILKSNIYLPTVKHMLFISCKLECIIYVCINL